MEAQLNASRTLVLLGITLFTLTFGAAPLILAPISEAYGRTYIYIVSALVFTLFFIPQALAQNIETMLVARFISGIAGSSAVSLVGGTLADVWPNEERGLPMALFAWSAFGSTGLGPVVFGYVEQIHDFRMINWVMFAVSGAFTLALALLLKETRGSVLLSRKAARLRKETGDNRYQCKADLLRSSFTVMMKTSLGRPIRMLCTEPVLISFTLWISFVWGVLYIFLVAIPLVFRVSRACLQYARQDVMALGICWPYSTLICRINAGSVWVHNWREWTCVSLTSRRQLSGSSRRPFLQQALPQKGGRAWTGGQALQRHACRIGDPGRSTRIFIHGARERALDCTMCWGDNLVYRHVSHLPVLFLVSGRRVS